jgi:hypothetical protein
MRPSARTHLAIGTAVVAVAALVAIAWMLEWPPGQPPARPAAAPPKVAVTGAPPESLSPGESVVENGTTRSGPSESKAPPAPPPPPSPPEPAPKAAAPPSQASARPPEKRPAPTPPRYAQRRAEDSPERSPGDCPSCGRIYLTATERDELDRIVTWEIRVRFDSGQTRTFRFDGDPRLRVGDRVRVERGRIHREP